MVGNSIGPMLRRAAREELMLIGGLAFVAAAGLVAALLGSTGAALGLMAAVNLGAAVGRLGFDAIVQRNAPDANQGQAFAKFETKFQLAWVIAGFVPVLITIPGWLGFAIVGGLAGFAMATYLVSMRRVRTGRPLPEPVSARARRQVQQRIAASRQRPVAPPGGSPPHPPTRWVGEIPPPPREPPSRPASPPTRRDLSRG